jgi:predicted ATP-dependent serine protease
MALFECTHCGAKKSETPGCHECRKFGMVCVSERLLGRAELSLSELVNRLEGGGSSEGNDLAIKRARNLLEEIAAG